MIHAAVFYVVAFTLFLRGELVASAAWLAMALIYLVGAWDRGRK